LIIKISDRVKWLILLKEYHLLALRTFSIHYISTDITLTVGEQWHTLQGKWGTVEKGGDNPEFRG
jgi:hypothetical protein